MWGFEIHYLLSLRLAARTIVLLKTMLTTTVGEIVLMFARFPVTNYDAMVNVLSPAGGGGGMRIIGG